MTGRELFERERPNGSPWEQLDRSTREGWEEAAAGNKPYFRNKERHMRWIDGRRTTPEEENAHNDK